MEDTVDIREGTFVWKVGDLSQIVFDSEEVKSPKFRLRKYNCCLDIFEYDKDTDTHRYEVHLNESKGDEVVNYNIFCKLCLIDVHGKVRLETKRTRLVFQEYMFLMTILFSDCCEGIKDVTLRLSWYPEEDIYRERGTQTVSDINSEEEPRKLLDTLSKDFDRFYENKVDTDFLLKVGEDQIPVHRAVLSARSKVFAAMFRHDTSENRSGVVDILDVDGSALRNVLYYIYSGQIRGMSADTICPMYAVADKYALIELRDVCLEFLMRNLSVENVCDAALLAHTHGETQLEEIVVQFVKEKLEEIEETDKWKEFLKSKSSLAFKLIRSALMVSKDEVKSLSSK